MSERCSHTIFRSDTSHHCSLTPVAEERCAFHTNESRHRTRETITRALEEAAEKEEAVYEADFSSVDLTELTFPAIEFVDADVTHARLQNVDLTTGQFIACSFDYADLRQARLQHSDLADSSFRGADLRGADLAATQLTQADFTGADLRGATLSRTNLTNATLQDTDLRHVNLDHTMLEYADLRNANLQAATLEATQLKHADLRESLLSEANITMASMEETRLDNARLNDTDIRDAFLQRSSLQDADLMNADVRDAYLDRADLGGTDLFNTDFEHSRLKGTRFAGARLNDGTTFDARVAGDPARDTNEGSDADISEAISVYRRLERVLSENLLEEKSTAYTIRRRRLEQQVARRDRRWGDYIILKLQNLAARYGQNPFRALAASAFIILLFALSYPALGLTTAGTTITYPASISELRTVTQALITGLIYSVRTFLPFVGPGAQPATTAAQTLTAVESLIGKLLLGLFGLDIAAQTGEGGEE